MSMENHVVLTDISYNMSLQFTHHQVAYELYFIVLFCSYNQDTQYSLNIRGDKYFGSQISLYILRPLSIIQMLHNNSH